MDQRTMRIKKQGRSRSTSSSSTSDTSRSGSRERSKWRNAETKTTFPKPLRFACERKKSPSKEDSHRTHRRRSISPYRKRNQSKSPEKSEKNSLKKDRSPPRRHRTPPRRSPDSRKSPERVASSSRSRRPERSPIRSRESRRRSRSRSRLRRTTPPLRRSRSPRRTDVGRDTRHRDNTHRNRHRDYSPHKDHTAPAIPPIDYAHLAHVITQMYPRQPFMPPHIVPPIQEFYPPYAIPPGPAIPPRPRFPHRPPIVYNNRTIKIFRPDTTTTTSTVTTVTTTSSNLQPCGSSTVTSQEEPDSEMKSDVGTDK